MTSFNIWKIAQITGVLLMLPAMFFPPLYLFLVAAQVILGIPALLFFYVLLELIKLFFANSKPVTKWVAALACLPGMLLITGGSALVATAAICNNSSNRIEWELSLFGLPAMIGTIIAVCISRGQIHRFIYPDLYYPEILHETASSNPTI